MSQQKSLFVAAAVAERKAAGQPAYKTPVVECWQELCERVDRTSPSEYPDMCLITMAELAECMALSESRAEARVAALERLINSPETDDWLTGARLEAAHQVERWGADHDAGKTAWDWFWLVGYLSQKAAAAQVAGDTFKAKHHTISTAAALLNWHRFLSGSNTAMRPGIDPEQRRVS